MTGKYAKGKKKMREEKQRRMEELALAAKLMYLEGYASEENPVPAPIEAYLPSYLMKPEDNPDGDAVYNMLSYPWKDSLVIGKRAGYPDNDPRKDYSMALPMDMVRNAKFPLPQKLPLKTANLTENQPKLKLNMYDKGGKAKKGNKINGVQYDPYGFPVTDTTGTASYEKMAEYLLGTRGGTRERMEDLMYDIASTESGATYDPAIKQIGGGPGRGIFQYEGPGGSNRAKDALTRAVAYYNSSKTEKMPEWLSNYIKESNGVYDFSKLTIPQQKALFLADYSQAKNIPFGDYMKGDITTEDMWAKYHKVSGADRPHFREMKAVGDKKKDARTMTSERFREIVTGKSFMP